MPASSGAVSPMAQNLTPTGSGDYTSFITGNAVTTPNLSASGNSFVSTPTGREIRASKVQLFADDESEFEALDQDYESDSELDTLIRAATTNLC